MAERPKILSDERAFELLKEKSKARYIKCWESFRVWIESHDDFSGDFELSCPEEELVMDYFRFLHSEDGMDYNVSSVWTIYSMVNGVFRAKYGKRLQDVYLRLGTFISAWQAEDINKAPVFEYEDIINFLADEE